MDRSNTIAAELHRHGVIHAQPPGFSRARGIGVRSFESLMAGAY